MRNRLREIWDRKVGVLLVLLAVIAGGLYYYDVREQEERSRCQAGLNIAFAENIVKRSAISVASDQADKALLLGVARLLAEPEAISSKEKREQSARFLALFTDYRQAAVDVDALRKQNPYPELDGAC